VRYGFETLGLKRLIALIDTAHEASIGTAEKAGLRYWKEVEIEGARSTVYGLSRDIAS
jgi:RimJ/RimL family protein N-acetyltransferase